MKDMVKAYRKIIYLAYDPEVSRRPILCNLTRLYDLTFNILKAQITPRKAGFMTIELWGSEENYAKGVEYLREHGVKISSIAQKISRDETSCTQCGTCTAICPNESLYLDRSSRLVVFDKERCTACGLCTKVCPVRAMHVEVENGNGEVVS